MKLTWTQFRDNPTKYLKGSKALKVYRRDGSYFQVKWFSPYVEDGVHKVKGSKKWKDANIRKEHRCNICGSTQRVVWVVPFDASYTPGWYCYKCRRARDIMDIKKAKKYGKIF